MKRPRLAAALGVAAVLVAGFAGAGWMAAGRTHQGVVQPATAPLPPEDPTGLPQLRRVLLDQTAEGRFMGVVLVAQGDRVLLRQAYGMADVDRSEPLTPTSRLRLASDSKQFTAAAILKLQDQGKLSVDDPVCRWFNPCPTGWEDIRLSHLLSHTSGLPDLMDRPGWGLRRETPATLAELTAETQQYRPRYPPGSKATYNNAGFNLLAEIVERASGLTYETYLQQTFFDPLGMTNTGSDADGAGHGIVNGYNDAGARKVIRNNANVSIIPGAGALYSTVDDIWKWETALHHGRLLSPTSYAQMIANHAPADQGLRPGARPRDWGFGLFVSDLGTGAVPEFSARQIYHTGSWAGFRNLISYQPDEDVTVIVLTNNYDQRDRVFLIVQQAMAEAMGRPFPTALKS
jgi:CubicO group peptidase (beta-lactamase class C family)